MTATILRFPGRPALRVVEALPSSTSAHLQREVQEVQHHLRQASRCFAADDTASIAEIGVVRGTEELEEALFFALTLKGCLNDDRDLRNMLLSRFERREGIRG